MNEKLKYFIKDEYQIIKALKDNETIIMGKKLSPLSQNNLTEITGFSKAKVNMIMNDLIEKGYVEYIENGKYVLTKTSLKIIERLESK